MILNPLKIVRKRLTAKLLLTLIFFGVLPVIFAGWIFVVLGTRHMEQRLFEYLSRSVELKERYIVSHLDRFTAETKFMAAIPGIESCATARMPMDRPECAKISDFLSRSIRLDPGLFEVYIMDPVSAEVFYSTDPSQIGKIKFTRDYFKNGKYGPYVTSIYYSLVFNELAITISVPIFSRQGELTAVLASRVGVRDIPGILAGIGAGARGERVYLATRFNFIISSDHDTKAYPFQEMGQGYPIDLASRGINGAARYKNSRGMDVYGAWQWIEPLRVALFEEKEYAVAMKPINELRRSVLLICAAASLTLSFIIILIGRGFTASIESMATVAEEFGKGDFSRRLQVSFEDERGRLARSFNSMAQDLELREKEMIDTHRALEHAYEELKSLDQMKTSLLSNVSHELRTPLASIRGYCELLNNSKLGALTHAQSHALDVMLRNIHRLSRLIENLLEFSGMEAGIAKFIPTIFDLRDLVAERFDSFLPMAKKLQVNMISSISREQLVISADHEKLGRMVDNLIDNALKFTKAGGEVKVTLAGESGKEGITEAVLTIEDSGVGIPEELYEKIFDRFFQVEYSEARRWGGMGIGLSIVKEVADMHGGRIKVKSRKGEGTRFIIHLPLVPPSIMSGDESFVTA